MIFFLNLKYPLNIVNNNQQKITKNDLNNSFLKIGLKILSENFLNPRFIHKSSLFHLLLLQNFKEIVNNINMKIYSLALKKGIKNESKRVIKYPKE